jgi:superfamily II DNA or RNA helicase
MIVPRDYQRAASDSIFREWQESDTTLAVLPTGCGKTILFADVIRRSFPRRAMVLAHREELIFQARDKIKLATGLSCEVEMGEYKANESSMFRKASVVVSTIQTQVSGGDGGGRMSKFDPQKFGVLIIDEAHHACSPTYRRVIDYYRSNPNLKVLGVTATPDRADEEALGQVFQSVAFDYEILDAVHDGWLVPIEQQMVHVSGLDLSHIRTTAGDLNGADLAAVMESEENLHRMAHPSIEIIGSKRALVFTSSVKCAETIAEIFNRHRSGMAAWVCGKTPKDDRRRVLSDFNAGRVQVVANCGVLCLDSQTEILTDTGWIGIREMTYDHNVANWINGGVFFEPPKFIVRRERLPGERMVVLETKNRSIRVTEDHRMLFRKRAGQTFNIVHARDLVGVDGELPISGIARPLRMRFQTPRGPKSSLSRRISANSYALRKLGMSYEESKMEAEKRLAESIQEYKQPDELTLEECELIGFWIGDGGKNILKSGGVEFTLCQWATCENIINRVNHLLESCGIDSVRRSKISKSGSAVVEWSLPRGTGFGPQRRRGVFPIEAYLNKSGRFLWALNCEQFDAFIRGYWMADGVNHLDSITPPNNVIICGARKLLLDTVQAVACVRGYRASLRKRNNHGHALWFVSLTKRHAHSMTKYRMQFESGWKQEMVWCVTSTTGNIITRRNGMVTVMGNTEGFDDPGVEVVIMGRPTKSRSLYSQMVGRATRPLPGVVDGPETPEERRTAIATSAKPSCLVVDFVGNSGRHKLVTSADILGGKVSDEAIERAIAKAKKTGKPMRMTEALDEEEEKLRKEREQRRLAEEARRARLTVKAKYSVQQVDPFDVLQLQPVKSRGWDAGKILSEKCRRILQERMGIDPDSVSYAEGMQLVREQLRRWQDGLCSFGQAKVLRKFGYDPSNIKFDEAKSLIDAIKNNGWRRPVEVEA